MSDSERDEVVNTVAKNPEAGVSPAPDAAKAAAARVVFLFCGENIPVFLLTVFAKNEKANLSTGERAVLVAAAKELIEDYRGR